MRIAILGFMFAASFYFYPLLPDLLPMHWNLAGQIDSYWPKSTAVWFIPVLASILLVIFHFLPRLDPKQANYRYFQPAWQAIQTGLLIFFAYLQFITFYAALFPHINILPLMFIGTGGLFLLLGRSLGQVRQNYFVGIKLPWTLSSVDNWDRTHRLAGRVFTLVGILTLFSSIIPFPPKLIFSILILCLLIPVSYSYWLFKSSNKLHKGK